jgi:hypothetical protein
MLLFLPPLFLMFFATPGLAETEIADQATGAVYLLGDPANDEVTLTNKLDGEMDSYVLTANCYATHPIYGLGAWQAVEGGWRIMVQDSQTVSFEGAAPLDNPACVPQ